MYPKITLDSQIVIQAAVFSNEIQILEAVDDPIKKIVKAKVQYANCPGCINWYDVWEKESYDNIGNWTDQQLADAVKIIVAKEFSPITV